MDKRIKICGLQTKEAVDEAVHSGATHLGFIFSASKRQVAPETVTKISAEVPDRIKKVGVFVDEPLEFIQRAIKIAGLDIVQLHGNESMTLIQKLNIPVIKAISDTTQAYDFEDVILLLDGPKGGSGEKFNWNDSFIETIGLPFFVAGGLNPDNVEAALERFQDLPHFYGLDVSSGVESHGVKDLQKIRSFIKKIKEQ